MSVLAHIGRGIEKKLLTVIVRAGEGQRLVEMFAEVPGVLSISHHHARGMGRRRVRAGQLNFDEKDVLVVLVGHGSGNDVGDAKFNLVGPDLGATEWGELLRSMPGRLVFINGASGSAPFLQELSARNLSLIHISEPTRPY